MLASIAPIVIDLDQVQPGSGVQNDSMDNEPNLPGQ
jgi:hypothetical protein